MRMIEPLPLIETEMSTTEGKPEDLVLPQAKNDRYSLSERMEWIPI
jgi:hypothetical protein